MKISSLTVLLLLISSGLLIAQTNQGNMLVAVSSLKSFAGSDLISLGYSRTKLKSNANVSVPDTDKTISINAAPRIGYFIIENLALGLDVNFRISTRKAGDGYRSVNTSFSAGPFIRYYIPTSKVLPFVELTGSLGSSKSKTQYLDFEDIYKSKIMSYSGGIGLAMPLGDKVTFDVLAGYNSLTIDRKEPNFRTISGTFGIKLGITVFLGAE